MFINVIGIIVEAYYWYYCKILFALLTISSIHAALSISVFIVYMPFYAVYECTILCLLCKLFLV